MKISAKFSQILSFLTLLHIKYSVWLRANGRSVRHLRKIAVLSAVIFTLVNAGMFSVQNGKTSAMTTINGKAYGLMPLEQAKAVLKAEHSSSKLIVNIFGKSVVLSAQESGVAVDANKTFEKFTNLTGWKKIPLVSAIGNLFININPIYSVDKTVLSEQLKPLIEEVNIPAKNAALVISLKTTEPVTIIPEEDGYVLNSSIAADQIADEISLNNLNVKVEKQTLKATWTELDLKAFLPAVESARNTSLTLESDAKKITISKESLAPMLRLDQSGAVLKMTLDQVLLKNYLNDQSSVFYIAPIATKTVLKDGTEVSRIEGIAGRKLDVDATVTAVTSAFENGIINVTPTISTLTPEVLATRTYSNTDTGLYKTIEDFALTHSGSYMVSAVELNGPSNRSAFYNADTKIITASTYKVFIAYGILQKIDNGSLSMSSSTSRGSVEDCIYKMIHISDNDCASALQTVLGWSAFDSKLATDGFTATKLNNYSVGDKWSTARDEMSLMTKLYNKELLSTESTDYLFNLMKQQVYRSGIPAGSRGSVVADKVGFLYALNHDIGIVYSPKATYAVVILTDNAGGWTNVKLLSQLIYDFYNQ